MDVVICYRFFVSLIYYSLVHYVIISSDYMGHIIIHSCRWLTCVGQCIYCGCTTYFQSSPVTKYFESSPVVSASSGSTGNTWNGHPGHVSPSETVASSASQYNPIYFQVCREFQRGTCSRQQTECRYAHPPESVTVDSTDNHITVCMDFLKGKCSRESCRYFHPPPHLQNQLKAVQQRANAAATNAVAQSQTLVGSSLLSFPLLAHHALDIKLACIASNLLHKTRFHALLTIEIRLYYQPN